MGALGRLAGQVREESGEEDGPEEHHRTGPGATLISPAPSPLASGGPSHPRPRAVIFDMDGLLVDSERTTRTVWQAATSECGFTLTDETYLTLIGLGADEAEQVLARQFGDGFAIPAFRERRLTRMDALLASGGAPFKPGAQAIVSWVAARGLPLGLATSSRRSEVRERLGDLTDLFTTITTRDNAARGKPHPDIFLAAAVSLGVPPAECLAIEDSFAGVRAATAAGMPVIMVPDLAPPTAEIATLAAAVYASLVEVQTALARSWDAAPPPSD
ncbi:MAG: HAD family phosphatase [Vicinamibacterales bacterium]